MRWPLTTPEKQCIGYLCQILSGAAFAGSVQEKFRDWRALFRKLKYSSMPPLTKGQPVRFQRCLRSLDDHPAIAFDPHPLTLPRTFHAVANGRSGWMLQKEF